MEYLVTGGAGFIGSHLVERLVEQKKKVRVVDNFITGKRENLAPVADRIELFTGDLADPAVCARVCEGVRIIFHEAALPSVPKSVADPATSHRSNLEATFQLLVAARNARVQRVIYAASSSAYGESPTLPKREDMPSTPLSPYAVQKLGGEHYCSVFARCYGLETISLRYFNVFGKRQDPASQYAAAIPAFITSILADRPPTIFGDGEQTRDFTYIENVVEANLLAMNAPAEKVSGRVFNVATGQRITLNDAVTSLRELTGYTGPVDYAAPRAGDIAHSLADISLARTALGYEPKVNFHEGLRRTILWYRGLATAAQ